MLQTVNFTGYHLKRRTLNKWCYSNKFYHLLHEKENTHCLNLNQDQDNNDIIIIIIERATV